jgi:hypothetical protein
LKKNYFSSHKLPKQQSTSFWSQGILGVNEALNIVNVLINQLFQRVSFGISFSLGLYHRLHTKSNMEKSINFIAHQNEIELNP